MKSHDALRCPTNLFIIFSSKNIIRANNTNHPGIGVNLKLDNLIRVSVEGTEVDGSNLGVAERELTISEAGGGREN